MCLKLVLRAVAGIVLGLVVVPAYAEDSQEASEPLKVCATIPDLGNLVKEVGGDEVDVTVLAKGGQDPHFMDAKPSYIKVLSQADLFVEVGLDLEVGWVPNLLQNARNGKILRGAPGYLDASIAVTPRELPAGIVDRAMGDVHPLGNPHYLLDPVNGLKVARAVRDCLAALRPARKDEFSRRFDAFAKRLAAALVGEKLAEKYDVEKLCLLNERGKLVDFLRSQKDDALLGGWIGRLVPFQGAPVVADHNIWPYFSARFGLKVIAFLEPKPGIAPTTRHLGEVAKTMKAQGVRAIFTVSYFDPRHARIVAQETGAKVLELAHQCGSRRGTDDYVGMVEYNVSQVERALKADR